MPRKLTEAEILISFRRAHGARYDYSLVRYSGASRHVRVICRVHGPFTVTPHHHKNGVGCRKCYFERRRAGIDYFIEVATRAHAGRYDYSRVPQNLKLNDEVLIHCLQHDRLFLQVARAHVDGHTGCRACLSNKLKGSPELRGQYKDDNLPLKNFIERAVKLHGAIYDYSRFVYHGVGVKGEIICSEHGPFYQTPSNHLRGTKCPDCARLLQHKNSFKEKCKSLGVNYWRALKRREAQMSEEKIFDDAFLRSERVVNPLCVHGINYPNMEAAVRALDPPASSATISRWLSSGISPEVAFAKIPNPGYAKGIIYLIEHTTSKRKYVGLTIASIEERWRRHIEQAEMARIKNFRSLHAAIRKHGPEQFHISEIDRGTTKAGLESKERQWIAKLDTLIPHGFNISPGGGSGGAHGRRITIDGICFPSVRAATEHVAGTRGISLSAAKKRIEKGRLDVRSPSKPGEAITKTPAYKAWSRLAYCVMNPKSKEYIPGVKVHKRWLDFQQFLAEVGQPPMAGMAFARLNKSRDFYPDNCIWMTKSDASMINAKQGKGRKKNGAKRGVKSYL